MNSRIVIAVLLGCFYMGYRQVSVARAYARLQEVPAAPQGAAGFAAIEPREPLANYIEPGRHTVFIFSANWCPACRSLEAQMPRFTSERPDVAVRVIDIDDRAALRTALAGTNFQPTSIPFVVIYDSQGALVADDGGFGRQGAKTLLRWIAEESNKANRPS